MSAELEHKTSVALEPFTVDAPYADRQQILVVPDEVAEAERQARKTLATAERSTTEEVMRLAIEAMKVTSSVVALTEKAIDAAMSLRQQGLEISTVGRSEVPEGLLPPGHPLDDFVYIGNPAEPNLYYPAAEFHRRVFEHKFCEAVELLMGLGASEITVERTKGMTREEAAEFNVALTPVDAAGASASRRQSQTSEALFRGTFAGSAEPIVPEHLVWLSGERSWQTLVLARREHGAANLSLSLRYETDFGVDANLTAKIEGVGLKIGGKFAEQRDTVWRLDAKFPTAARTK